MTRRMRWEVGTANGKAARAARKAKEARKFFVTQVPADPETAAYGARCDARMRSGQGLPTVGSRQARSTTQRKAPITLPSLSILRD